MTFELFIKFLAAAIVSGIPIMYGTLGEILTEKSGNLNLGVEGMMAVGAFAGFYFGYVTDSVIMAVIGSFIAGALAALIYAFLTITLKANQNVTGLTLTIFGVGLADFLGEFVRSTSDSSVIKLSDGFTSRLGVVNIPVLSDIPVIGELFFNYTPLVYFAVFLCIICGIYANHTRAGLNLKAVGENPAAADAAGINVTAVKYLNTLVGGGICGIGGAYISLTLTGGVWTSDCIGGLGWIAVALVIFANWNPFLCIAGSIAFGAFRVLKFYLPSSAGIPDAVFSMLPFAITALVLIVTSMKKSKRNSQPASCGLNYFREEIVKVR